VTDETSAQLLVDTALERYGRLDIVINNAGGIQVGPVQTADMAHFDTALNTMALAPVRLALSALPVMRSQGHGRIVTIASIGGKLSVPRLLPYSTAKFAAVGFSEGLRAELGRGPVTVTTVVPGLMRTGSHVQAGPLRAASTSTGSDQQAAAGRGEQVTRARANRGRSG
jgi:NAD(P)-dependent dehydrogenase (short-subunit alcohol dehydrogenase family)